MPTPHISAKNGDFAKTVLMPGDPLRAKLIAEKYLHNARLVNEVRGMLGYTGNYKGKRVSVMASGMGVPSMGIYSYELYKFYGVAYECARSLGIKVNAGPVLTSDIFYDDTDDLLKWQRVGVKAVEMECAALYMNAACLGKKALTICTVSDCPLTGESSSSEEREKSFDDMMTLGLECAVSL